MKVATDWPLYPKLREQILTLEAEAALVLAREKADAVAWIRREVEVHGLTPRDIGFR